VRIPLPPIVDLHVQRVARSLSVLELMGDDDFQLHEEDLLVGDLASRSHEAFLNFYSHDGLRKAMSAYGFDERLEELGLSDNELVIAREDAFHHRLSLYVGGGRDAEHRVMDMRVHLRHVAEPGDDEEAKGRQTYGVMIIEWLSMQNPRGQFTKERPQLPGQDYPGTGMGRLIHNVLMVSAERTRRDALMAVPAHFHLARLYLDGGYRYPKMAAELELEAVIEACEDADLSFAPTAWAVERGFVRVRTPQGDRPWEYRPEEMVLPLTSRLRSRLPGLREWVAEKFFHPVEMELFVDVDGLRRSLAEAPVACLGPDDF
jgi:hypothetical protein